MKSNILALAAFTALLLTSCNKQKTMAVSSISSSDTLSSSSSDSVSVATTKDDIVKSTAKDKSGKVLDMSFNNTKNTATLVFNGETIELEGQKPASGIWYKNDHYELRGKGEEIELSKDGNVIFKQ
ncbi:hypothetical protein CJF12_19140 [Chryseobacterium piperi]|uniref:MliC family protein n=1 Tax=Chryseobacterium piperi TaxID=558152 RepID=UPI0005563C0B